MQPSKKNASLPQTFVVHTGRSPLIVHQYSVALFMCQEGFKTSSKFNSWHEHNKFFYRYKTQRLFSDAVPSLQYPGPIRVRSGKPIHSNLLTEIGLFLDISEHTRDFCSFDHDLETGLTTLVLDESKLERQVPQGCYRAALQVDSPVEFWNQGQGQCRKLINTNSDCQVSLLLTLTEYVCPLSSAKQPRADLPCPAVISSLSFYIDDFRATFNL